LPHSAALTRRPPGLGPPLRARLVIMASPKFPETIPALRKSWQSVVDLGLGPVGVLFFKRIFEIAPQALALFSFKDEPADKLYESPILKAHAIKVMKTVGVAVSMLDDLENLLPVLEGLGKKHVAYGVIPAHYGIVGQALLDTLALGLGDAFTPELKDAWSEIYGVVSSTMIKGSNKEAAPPYEEWGRYAAVKGMAQFHGVQQSQDAAMDWYLNPAADLRGR